MTHFYEALTVFMLSYSFVRGPSMAILASPTTTMTTLRQCSGTTSCPQGEGTSRDGSCEGVTGRRLLLMGVVPSIVSHVEGQLQAGFSSPQYALQEISVRTALCK